MTEEQQKAIFDLFPDAEMEYDINGEVIIYTGTWGEILPTGQYAKLPTAEEG